MFKASIEGFVATDPALTEVMVKGEKRKVLNFRVGVSNGHADSKKETVFFGISLWGEMAERAAGVLKKGNFVLADSFWIKASTYGENHQVNLALMVNRFRYKFPGTQPGVDEDYSEIPFDGAEMEMEGSS